MNKIFLLVLIALIYQINITNTHAQNNMNIIAQFQGEQHGYCFGMSMASLDFNHDSYCDLVVSSPGWGYIYPGTTSPSKGKVYIYFGGPAFNSNTPASVTLEGTFNGTTGWQILEVYNVGDINGDGFDDLCIEDYAPWSTWEHRLMFFYGGTSDLNNPDYVMNMSDDTNIGFVNKLGDVNGDGFDDIGFTYYTTGQYLIFSVIMGGNLVENVVMTYSYYLAYGLFTLSGIGDINNDGYADFTIAYTNDDPDTGYHLITVYYGNSTGAFSDPQTIIQTQEPITKISKPLGDINNDGFDDFMGYISNAGTNVWLGSNSINFTTPSFNLSPGWTGGEASQSLEHGDFNNDGFEDAVGASFNQREAAVYLGRAIPNGTSDLILHQHTYENFGFTIATGDYNADGYCDIAISAPKEDDPWPTGSFYGFVFIYGGNSQLADTAINNDESAPAPNDKNWAINLFPNPLTGRSTKLNLCFTGSGYKTTDVMQITLYDIKGRTVLRQNISLRNLNNRTWSASLEGLHPGVYLVSLSADRQIRTAAKLVILP